VWVRNKDKPRRVAGEVTAAHAAVRDRAGRVSWRGVWGYGAASVSRQWEGSWADGEVGVGGQLARSDFCVGLGGRCAGVRDEEDEAEVDGDDGQEGDQSEAGAEEP